MSAVVVRMQGRAKQCVLCGMKKLLYMDWTVLFVFISLSAFLLERKS